MQTTALITGSAVRIGAEIARRLAADGHAIGLHCHGSHKEAEDLAESLRAQGSTCTVAVADLAAHHAATGIFRSLESLPPVTTLILNASYFERDALETLTPESFETHFRVNLFASLALIREFAARLPEAADGSVIALLDGMHGWSLSPHFLSYSLSRLAMESAIRLLATELAPRIRINGIAPGLTLPGKMDSEGSFDRIAARTPLKRASSPEEVTGAIAFLLDSPSMTGQILSLAGGLHLQPM